MYTICQFSVIAILQLAGAGVAPTAFFADEPDAENDAPADTSARWTDGLTLGDPNLFIQQVVGRKRNAVDRHGQPVNSLGEATGLDSDDSDTESSEQKSTRALAKGKKKARRTCNETLAQLPQSTGVSMAGKAGKMGHAR